MILEKTRPADVKTPRAPPSAVEQDASGPQATVCTAAPTAAPTGGVALVLQARALRHEQFAPAAAAVLNGLTASGFDGWVTTELSWYGDTDADESCTANRAYLRSLGY